MVFSEWNAVLFDSFRSLGTGVFAYLPRLVLAVLVFLIGWLVASILGKLVAQVIGMSKIDRLLQKTGIEEPLKRANLSLNSGAFIGGLVRWFFLIGFLLAVMDILGLSEVNIFLQSMVLPYLMRVIVATLILIAAIILSDAAQRVVIASAKAAKVASAGFLGGVAKWSIWIFAVMAALYQLGIMGPLIQTLFTAFVAMLAIAGGLAFGLGGKDAAAQFIEKMRKDIKTE